MAVNEIKLILDYTVIQCYTYIASGDAKPLKKGAVMNILKAFRLDESLVERLAKLAQGTHRTEKFYVEEALRYYFAEYEDCQIAKDRFNDPKSKVLTSQEMRKRLGV